jgi:hypothetical protein
MHRRVPPPELKQAPRRLPKWPRRGRLHRVHLESIEQSRQGTMEELKGAFIEAVPVDPGFDPAGVHQFHQQETMTLVGDRKQDHRIGRILNSFSVRLEGKLRSGQSRKRELAETVRIPRSPEPVKLVWKRQGTDLSPDHLQLVNNGSRIWRGTRLPLVDLHQLRVTSNRALKRMPRDTHQTEYESRRKNSVPGGSGPYAGRSSSA